MNKKTLLNFWLLLLCMIVGGASSAWAEVSWVRVTSIQTLFEGGTFIMGYEATAKSGVIVPLRSKDCGATTSANGILNSGTTNGSSTDGTIDMADLSKVTTSDYEVYITGIKVNEVYKYVNIQRATSTGNYYGASSGGSSKNTARLYSSGNSNETNILPEWSSETNNQFKLSANVSGSYKYLKYNTGSPRYAFYNSAGEKIVFYKKVTFFTLTYSATNGSISGEDAGSNAVVSGANVVVGARVTLTATPASGYAFIGWNVSGTGSTLSSTSMNPTTFTMGTANATVTATFASASVCATPTFTVDAGTYNETKNVELNCGTDGATIYYTTDGKDPTTTSSEYSSAIPVIQTTTIKAFAVKDGLEDSGIASATYTLKCATPEITVPAGVFLDSKVVTMTSSAGASIYYTTDGSTPTSSSTAYDPSNKPSISATTTIKAIATKSGWSDSDVATENFTKIVPMTVGEALTAISALASNGTIANQYVSGIVSTTGSVSSGAVTYYISADGTTTSQLQVYKGKGIDGADFTALTNLDAGDEVVVYGTLKNYNGTTPEFDAGSQLVKRVTKETPTFSLDPTSKTLDAYTKESVDVTLTTNTDGAITCESDDEDVATVALKSGNVYTITAKSEGNATITIRSAASATYKRASATVDITVEDARADAGISFANDNEEITWGESYTGQALTNTNSVSVTWSSTDEDVATVNSSTGAITILKAGETDIKATFAGNDTYKAAVASYTLTVNKAEAGISYTTTTFDIMLNDDTFETPTLNNPNSLTGITYSSNNTAVATVNTTTGELSYVATAAGTAKITATFTGNDWYKSSSANYTITIIDPTVKGSKYNPYSVAEVREVSTSTTISDVYVEGYIIGFVNSTYGFTTTTTSFTNTNWCIADSKDESDVDKTTPVQISGTTPQATYGLLAHKDLVGAKVLIKGDITKYFSVSGVKSLDEINVSKELTITTAKYATHCSTNALDFSKTGIKVYKAKVTDNMVKLTEIDNGIVPGNTGIILYKDVNSTTTVPVPVTTTTATITDNELVGVTTRTEVVKTSGGKYNYIMQKDGESIVFNMASESSGSYLPANRAYLSTTVDASAGGARLSVVFDDETTVVQGVSVHKTADDVFYNLKGQRVENPKKGGIYVKNGKKVIFK